MIWDCLQAHSSLQKKSLGVFRKAREFSAALETLNQISPGANIQTRDNKSSVQAISHCLSHSARVICSLPKVEHINILLIFILKNSEESTKTKFLSPTFFLRGQGGSVRRVRLHLELGSSNLSPSFPCRTL